MIIDKVRSLWEILLFIIKEPKRSFGIMKTMQALSSGSEFGEQWKATNSAKNAPIAPALANPLMSYFEANIKGRGIWKWQHYFDIYHHHFSKFVGREVHIVEIGVFSGGS